MKFLLLLLVLLACVLSVSVDAFLFEAYTPHPALKDIIKSKQDFHLDVRLSIDTNRAVGYHYGKSMSSKKLADGKHKLFLDGLSLDLLQNTDATGHVNLPGADGPHPKTSSGARAVKVDHLPYYIGMNGMEEVKLERGAWEIIWCKDSGTGSLICAFHMPFEVRH